MMPITISHTYDIYMGKFDIFMPKKSFQINICFTMMIIVPLIDIPMFNLKYLAMHKVQMHAGAISSYCMVLRV